MPRADTLTTDLADAFRRGAEAMREAATDTFGLLESLNNAVAAREMDLGKDSAHRCSLAAQYRVAAMMVAAMPAPDPPPDLLATGWEERG